jgi:hypothetical protein
MIHTTIFGVLLFALSGLWGWAEHVSRAPTAARTRDRLAGPWRAARWVTAGWRYQLARLAADVREAAAPRLPELRLAYDTGEVATLPLWRTAPVVADDWLCGYCGEHRCRDGREGRDCRLSGHDQPTAYAAGHPLPADGRHAVTQAVARWLAGDWWNSPLPAVERLRLARLAGMVRSPVQLAGPVGWLP